MIICVQERILYKKRVIYIQLQKSPFLRDGTVDASKTDEFSEMFQTAFDLPLILGKSRCIFSKKNCLKVQNMQLNFGIQDDPPPCLLLWNFSENSSILVESPVPYRRGK